MVAVCSLCRGLRRVGHVGSPARLGSLRPVSFRQCRSHYGLLPLQSGQARVVDLPLRYRPLHRRPVYHGDCAGGAPHRQLPVGRLGAVPPRSRHAVSRQSSRRISAAAVSAVLSPGRGAAPSRVADRVRAGGGGRVGRHRPDSHIASQNHFSKFLQSRPSRSNNSSASFGPQVPDA